MLEESRMDKKTTNRSSQPQSRASAVDCKKGSETTHKPAARYNKKREGPSCSTPKNEPYRKNVSAQRGRGQLDRRPRPRGAAGFPVGGAESSGLADEEPEHGSVFVPGSKKQNLNHLLNFMYTPRGVQGQAAQGSGRGAVPRRNVMQRVTHPHNHDLYLQACCQFVVKEDGEYKANLLDPDVPVKWEQIEEIVVRSTGKSECPICLGPPSAGRVGRCGHVHCWACALHYAAAHERAPPPCPVCAAPFRVGEMRPARLLQWEPPMHEVTMILVRRLRGSTAVEVAPPRGQLTDIAEAKILPLSEINNAPYAKLFTATKQQARDILERERRELQNQILDEIDTTEIVYIEQALEMLKKQEEDINAQVNVPKLPEKENDLPPIVYEKTSNGNKIDWFDEEAGAACMESIQDQMASLSVDIDRTNLNPEAAEFTADVNVNEVMEFPLIDDPVDEQIADSNYLTDIDKENQAKYFYFYQASDGQQIFLSSINVRLLNASWGALAAAPPRLRGTVLARATHSLIEQTRKHMPYAAHLPLHCPFDIVELDLQPPYVTPLALDTYAAELSRLARLRARTERSERRRERTARLAAEPPPRPDFSSDLLFPPTPPAHDPLAYQPSPPPAHSPPQHEPEGLSFAKMARSSGTWRVRASPPAPPAAATDEGEETGAEMASLTAPRALLLSDAIAAALQAPAASAAAAPHGKKKRNKPKVLFATGMPRTG